MLDELVTAEKIQVAARRAAIASRRANLSTARSLLSSLASASPTTSSLSLPYSLPALEAQLESLVSRDHDLAIEATRVRRILSVELLAVFALQRTEQPLPDPFLPTPLNQSMYPPTATVTVTSTSSSLPQAYALTSLPLPPLSALLTLPNQELEALLSHILHITRLLALYEGVLLPFTPLPSCFGPGKAGMKATPGWGLRDARHESDERDRDASLRPSKEGSKRVAGAGPGGHCWPLCFAIRRSGSSARNTKSQQEMALDEVDSDDTSSRKSARSSKSDLRSSTSRGTKRSTKRAKAVLVGAVALAFDLAYVAWSREVRSGRMTDPPLVEELEDLGALITKAADVDAPEPPARPPDPFARRDYLSPSAFPISFPHVVAHYTALAFASPSSGGSTSTIKPGHSRTRTTSDSMGDSGVVVRGVEEDDEEDEEDEDWDLVDA
ncbi:serine/arginine repetitive matrix protein 2 [Rhodotorula toruloides]|uniref:Autophagy-related protein 14 n=1 Tax=Rhodotorula toruloides TaxID=5286 RepID=A0A511KA77_RHOTO|nr:serine/arginine repetitive matrix protein 2 [Rhodotorula toruloides]